MTTRSHPPRIAAPAAFAGLFALEMRRLLRGWRWRATMLLAVAVSVLLARFGPDFGEGATVFFPGAAMGIRALGLLFAAGGLVLAIDLGGEADHRRARQALDARPASGLLLQSVRLATVAASLAVPAALACVLPPLLARTAEGGEAVLFAPNAALLAFFFVPALLVPPAAGLAARSLAPNDAAAATLGVVLLAPWYWFAFVGRAPQELFLSASRILGLLVPFGTMLSGALAMMAPAGPLLALAALNVRARRGTTPLRSMDPPLPARLLLARRIAASLRPRGRLATGSALAAVALAAIGAPGTLHVARLAVEALTLPPPRAIAADWSRMRAPAGAERGIVRAPSILGRTVRVESLDDARIEVVLELAPFGDAEQTLAALTFGPACRVAALERLGGGSAATEPDAASPHLHATVLRFDPPLRPDETTSLRVALEPSERAAEGWRRLRHPTYATFQNMPLWYGAGMTIRYAFSDFAVFDQAAPFALDLPSVAPRAWVAAGRTAEDSQGRAHLAAANAASLQTLFAASVATVESPEGAALAVRFVVFPEHEATARALHVVYEGRFERLARAFGAAREPFAFVEVPSSSPADPFALSSGTLDLLTALLPEHDDLRAPTAWRFEEPFARMHRAIVESVVLSSHGAFEHPELLRDALVEYLHATALAEGRTGRFRLLRRDYVYVPWHWLREPSRYPFDLLPRDEGGFTGPALAGLRDPGAPPVPRLRLVAFHHMLRARLGDEGWRTAMATLFAGPPSDGPLTLDAYRAAAEAAAGEPLESFFRQWLVEGVIPKFRLKEADVVLAQNDKTRTLEYTTRVVVANEGTGTVRVPLVLEVEGDRIEKIVEPAPGGEATVVFATPERPLSVSVDPDGWIVQMPEVDARTGKPVHPRLFLKTVREL